MTSKSLLLVTLTLTLANLAQPSPHDQESDRYKRETAPDWLIDCSGFTCLTQVLVAITYRFPIRTYSFTDRLLGTHEERDGLKRDLLLEEITNDELEHEAEMETMELEIERGELEAELNEMIISDVEDDEGEDGNEIGNEIEKFELF